MHLFVVIVDADVLKFVRKLKLASGYCTGSQFSWWNPVLFHQTNSLTVHYLAAPGQLITYIIVSELGCNVIELYTVIGTCTRGWSKTLWTKEKEKKKISRLRTNLTLHNECKA